MKFSKLMESIRIQNIEVRNRIVMAPMLSRLCNPNGVVSPKLVDYYAERAKGGVGLIIVEYCYIDAKESKAFQEQLGVYDDQLIPGLADLAEAIQEWGARAVLQLCHAGRGGSVKFSGRQPIAPSPMRNYLGEMTREMTPEEIESTINSFADAALRAKTAGFDGVELHGAHGYLLAQFLSPYTNHRTDIYGKDRGLLALQTLDRVRSKVGRNYLIGYRMSAEEFVDGGVTLEETKAFAKRLEGRSIDYLHVSAAMLETGMHFVTPSYLPRGYLLRFAEEIKRVVNIPVIAVGAIHDPGLAEEALQKKKADLIAMGRALIADPELPNKIKSGRPEDIRTCLRCNDGCSSQVRMYRSLRCSVNSEVGRERAVKIHPTERAKQVCVIGGGPAGMEAARVLAERKHRVTLIEREKELGGLLRYAGVPEFKAELRSFLEYQKTQVKKLGVEVLLNREATPEFVEGLRPDAVVLAAGSRPFFPVIPGIDKSFVASAIDLLSGRFRAGERVVVAGGAAVGCEIAAYLASSGKKVTVVEMLDKLALDLEWRSRAALLQLMKSGGVELLTNCELQKIEEGKVVVVERGRSRQEVLTDSVILALGLTSNQELLNPLKEKFNEFHVIGDCVEPRKVYEAIHEGAFVGRVI